MIHTYLSKFTIAPLRNHRYPIELMSTPDRATAIEGYCIENSLTCEETSEFGFDARPDQDSPVTFFNVIEEL
jgi:hypothetical protein